jgi:hypothetical protein
MRKDWHHGGEVGVCVRCVPRAAQRTVARMRTEGGIERQRGGHLQGHHNKQQNHHLLELTQFTAMLRNV